MAQEIQIRRDTAANWTSVDPTMAQGELGYETDTDKLKIGDGSTAWTSLDYLISGGAGDVVGPGSAVDENIVVFDGVTGKLIKDSTINKTAVEANTTHRTSDGSDHSFLDQSVISGATPTFTNTNFSEATDKNYVTDAEAVVIGNTSGSNTGDEDAASIAAINHAASVKSALVNADEITGQDSADSFSLIRTTWTSVKAFLKTYFDTIYFIVSTGDTDDITEGSSNLYNQSHTADVTGATTLTIINNIIDPARLAIEFKTIVALGGGINLDWSAGQTFTKTLSGDPTYTFSNLHVGVKFLETTGDYSPTFPSGFTYVGGTRDASGTTLYQVVCTNTSTPVGYYSIYKDES